jgi:Carbohydrate binding module (family 6)
MSGRASRVAAILPRDNRLALYTQEKWRFENSGRVVRSDHRGVRALTGTSTATPPDPPWSPSTGSTPYSGTPIAIPSTVQFENYDAGGANVAYFDTGSGNTGGAYRSNNVDIKAASDSGGGYLVGWTKAEEWLKYTVAVAQSRSYTLTVRLVSDGVGGTFHIEVSGVNVTGSIQVPDTGGWQTWKTVTKTGVTLPAGTQVLKVVLDANGPGGSVGNFNWFAFQ